MELEPNRPVYDWPLADGEAGNEVWFLLVTSADGSVSFWYHLELAATGDRQLGRSWAAVMDNEAGELAFSSLDLDVADIRLQSRPFRMQFDDHEVTARQLQGSIDGTPSVSWDLEWDPDTYAFTPLRSHFLSNVLSNTLGTGKYWSRNSSIHVDGTVTVGDRTVEFAGAPGSQGHIMTPRSPMDLTWLHCNQFEPVGRTVDTGGDETPVTEEIVLEALQFGRFCSCYLRIDDEVYEFNRLFHVVPVGPTANTVEYNTVGNWRFRADSRRTHLRATVDAPPDRWHRAVQFPPSGEPQYVAHCPFASLELAYRIDERWVHLESEMARAEWHRKSPPLDGDFQPDWGI